MRTRTYGLAMPRLALALAAVVMASTTLGVLVLVPAVLEAGGGNDIGARQAARSPEPPAVEAWPSAAEPRTMTVEAHKAKGKS